MTTPSYFHIQLHPGRSAKSVEYAERCLRHTNAIGRDIPRVPPRLRGQSLSMFTDADCESVFAKVPWEVSDLKNPFAIFTQAILDWLEEEKPRLHSSRSPGDISTKKQTAQNGAGTPTGCRYGYSGGIKRIENGGPALSLRPLLQAHSSCLLAPRVLRG
jgi:hypothetical protein